MRCTHIEYESRLYPFPLGSSRIEVRVFPDGEARAEIEVDQDALQDLPGLCARIVALCGVEQDLDQKQAAYFGQLCHGIPAVADVRIPPVPCMYRAKANGVQCLAVLSGYIIFYRQVRSPYTVIGWDVAKSPTTNAVLYGEMMIDGRFCPHVPLLHEGTVYGLD